MKKIDLLGKKFFRLNVIEQRKNPKSTSAHWWCRCDCGVEKMIKGTSLLNGDSKSCGCWNRELRKAAWKRGENSPLWKGGRSRRKDGYITVYVGEKSHKFEHIVVMESIIGRKLTSNESVHHINGVRDDNRKENLELWSKSHPFGQRVEDKVKWAIELLKLYKPEILQSDKTINTLQQIQRSNEHVT